jgi:hypothetical protein
MTRDGVSSKEYAETLFNDAHNERPGIVARGITWAEWYQHLEHSHDDEDEEKTEL